MQKLAHVGGNPQISEAVPLKDISTSTVAEALLEIFSRDTQIFSTL